MWPVLRQRALPFRETGSVLRTRGIFVVLVVPCVFCEKGRGNWSTDSGLERALGQAGSPGGFAVPGMVPTAQGAAVGPQGLHPQCCRLKGSCVLPIPCPWAPVLPVPTL